VKVDDYERNRVVVATNGHMLVALFASGKRKGVYTLDEERIPKNKADYPNWAQVVPAPTDKTPLNRKNVLAACRAEIRKEKEKVTEETKLWKKEREACKTPKERKTVQSRKPSPSPRLALTSGKDPDGLILWEEPRPIQRFVDPEYLLRIVRTLGTDQTVILPHEAMSPLRFDSPRGFAVLMPQRK
jgi:hypothetical protein